MKCRFCRGPCVLFDAPAISGTTMHTVDDWIGYQSISVLSCSMSKCVRWLGLLCSIGFVASCNVTCVQALVSRWCGSPRFTHHRFRTFCRNVQACSACSHGGGSSRLIVVSCRELYEHRALPKDHFCSCYVRSCLDPLRLHICEPRKLALDTLRPERSIF